MDAHSEFACCRCTALIRGDGGVRREGLETVVEAKLTIGHVQECRIAAMPIQEDDLARIRLGDAASDVVEDGKECGGREPHRAGSPRMLVGLGVRQCRQEPHVQVGRRCSNGRFRDGRGDDLVGVERQVWAVLFDRAEWLHENRR